MADPDIIVVGAGPAGAVAATLAARAGAQVRLIERGSMPRHKLCGDTLNPAAIAILRRLSLAEVADGRGLAIEGMRVTGSGGVSIESRYPGGLGGRALSRSDLDASLVAAAVAAGVDYLESTAVRGALIDAAAHHQVVGVRVGTDRQPIEMRSRIVIAADGRHSTIAFGLGLARHPIRPRRWAIGGYFSDMHGLSAFGEMHIRPNHYIGVAPLPGGLANVCLVKSANDANGALRNPTAALRAEIALDVELRDRLASAIPVSPAHVLGPLAVDPVEHAVVPRGLLLAGDASGFVDPMTGDGLRFALRGGELAAAAALRALEHGWIGVHEELARQREREFGGKWRFNRALRGLVGSPLGVWAATKSARLAPSVVRALITRASDCDIAAATC